MRIPALLLLLAAASSFAAPAENVILITADGLRWQEVFRGADARLLADERFTPKGYDAFPAHQQVGAAAARERLMPFFWRTVARSGAVIGDRDANSLMRVTNPYWFSYPGYNELLTGRADPRVDSNEKRWNTNITILEWLNRRHGFEGRVQAFGSWDAFPYIVNTQRSGVPVSAEIGPVVGAPTKHEQYLMRLQRQTPLAFPAVRHDMFTHNYALEALRSDRPRVLYIAYGETDDFAHEGQYGEYLNAAHRFDSFLQELWETIQADHHYRNRTALVITTDHGRGETPLESWPHHASAQAVRGYSKALSKEYPDGIIGSDQIWAAALGAGIDAKGVIATDGERTQAQIAATVLRALEIPHAAFDAAAAAPLEEFFDE